MNELVVKCHDFAQSLSFARYRDRQTVRDRTFVESE